MRVKRTATRLGASGGGGVLDSLVESSDAEVVEIVYLLSLTKYDRNGSEQVLCSGRKGFGKLWIEHVGQRRLDEDELDNSVDHMACTWNHMRLFIV